MFVLDLMLVPDSQKSLEPGKPRHWKIWASKVSKYGQFSVKNSKEFQWKNAKNIVFFFFFIFFLLHMQISKNKWKTNILNILNISDYYFKHFLQITEQIPLTPWSNAMWGGGGAQ